MPLCECDDTVALNRRTPTMADTPDLTIDDITAAFNDAGLKYRHVEHDVVELRFTGLDTYRNPDGEAAARILVDSRSRRLVFAMPMAWRVPTGENRAAVLETCLRLQWEYFGIRFEFDHHDGELRAAFDFLVHAVPTASRVVELLHVFLHVVTTVHPAIDAAIRDGNVYERPNSTRPGLNELIDELSELSPEQIQVLLAAVREGVSA